LKRFRTILQARETLYVGIAVGVATIVSYGVHGYSSWIAWLWLAAILVILAHLRVTSGPLGRPSRWDLAAPGLLVLAFSPLYLLRLTAWPVQVNSDEVTIMTYAKQYASAPHVDLFGLSQYFGHPAGLLVVWGHLGNLLGGIDLGHMRLLHALCGLVVIGASYAFFRQFFTLPWALLGSAVLGLNHAFLMISRMAMRENTPVLVEVVALALLLIGLRKRNAFATFAGGGVAGLGYYVHFPGRMVFPLWLAFLVLLALAYRGELGLGKTLRLGAVAAAAFALVAGPYLIAYEKAPAVLKHHQREALLLTSDGRKLQQRWVFAPTIWGGIERNIVNGLTAFNTNRDDHANIYPNAGHGIVDPLTGALLWLGALVVLVRARRRRGPPWLVFPLFAFLVLWLAYAFLVGQAPDYPRMLIVLPFVTCLVVEGVRFLAVAAARLPVPRRRLATVLPAAAVLLAIGVWNGSIGWDFIHQGQLRGDDIGSTGRYVQRYSGNPNEHFYLAADQTRFPYYVWGWPSIWLNRLRMFSKEDSQIGGVINPNAVGQFAAAPPFVVFMRSDVWSRSAPGFMAHYPQARTDKITPDGRLIAVDVT
jgi:hypothetical protein